MKLPSAPLRTGGPIAVFAVMFAAAGCGSKTGRPIPGQSDASFATIQNEILTPGCAFGSCHGGAAPAVGLDLSSGDVCSRLRQASSCVVSGRRLVVGGSSEASFLVQKLVGENLAPPDGSCGVATNRRMPYGGEPLAEEKLRLIREWIDEGAVCPGDTVDGTDAMPGGGGDAGVPVQTISVDQPTLAVGERTKLHVELSAPATGAGQLITLEIGDRDAVGSPPALLVPSGAREAEAELVGKRPAPPTNVRAVSGESSAETRVTVKGLAIVEVFTRPPNTSPDRLQWVKIRNTGHAAIDLAGYAVAAGRARWGETLARLSGVLAAGACAVAGGPDSSTLNGSPRFTVLGDFSPDLPTELGAGQGNAGFGIVLSSTIASDGQANAPPIDAVGVGSGTVSSRLLDADGAPLTIALPEPAPGASAALTLAGWRPQPPDPGSCP